MPPRYWTGLRFCNTAAATPCCACVDWFPVRAFCPVHLRATCYVWFHWFLPFFSVALDSLLRSGFTSDVLPAYWSRFLILLPHASVGLVLRPAYLRILPARCATHRHATPLVLLRALDLPPAFWNNFRTCMRLRVFATCTHYLPRLAAALPALYWFCLVSCVLPSSPCLPWDSFGYYYRFHSRPDAVYPHGWDVPHLPACATTTATTACLQDFTIPPAYAIRLFLPFYRTTPAPTSATTTCHTCLGVFFLPFLGIPPVPPGYLPPRLDLLHTYLYTRTHTHHILVLQFIPTCYLLFCDSSFCVLLYCHDWFYSPTCLPYTWLFLHLRLCCILFLPHHIKDSVHTWFVLGVTLITTHLPATTLPHLPNHWAHYRNHCPHTVVYYHHHCAKYNLGLAGRGLQAAVSCLCRCGSSCLLTFSPLPVYSSGIFCTARCWHFPHAIFPILRAS